MVSRILPGTVAVAGGVFPENISFRHLHLSRDFRLDERIWGRSSFRGGGGSGRPVRGLAWKSKPAVSGSCPAKRSSI